MTGNARLEDFGVRESVSPEERLAEYRRQCKELPQNRQAKFWLECLGRDAEAAKLVGFKTTRKGGRKK